MIVPFYFKMKKLNIFILVFLFLFPFTAKSVKAEFRFDYDYCVFKNPDSRLTLEFYYSIYLNQLKFDKTVDGYEAYAFIDLEIISKQTNNSIFRQPYSVPVFLKDTANAVTGSSTGQVNIILDSGMYVINVKATDFKHAADTAKYIDNLSLSRFTESKVSMSCVQISSNIQESKEINSPFYKNTLEVVPSTQRVFGNNLTNIYYYFEVYNLTKENITENYVIKAEITDTSDNVIKKREKKHSISKSSQIEVGTFNISELITGNYKLIIRVFDDKSNEIIRSQKKFVVINTGANVQFSNENYELSEYAKYSEGKLDDEFEHAIYLASDKEREVYKSLNNLEAKRKFMFEFWKTKSINKKDYAQRIKYANDNYAYNFKEGWKTDRGRIYVTYGKPDELDRFPFESNAKAYEIWKYNDLEGGVIFVFIDMGNATGDYGLEHSTARNELRNDNWRDKLRIK